MNNVINVFAFFALTLFSSLFTSVQAAENNYKAGYISDELSIYMHAGPGTNYKIIGTITAGSDIQITGAEDSNYSEIIDNKNRTAWVETKFTTTTPGLRVEVSQLKNKLSTSNTFTSQLDGEVNELKSKVNSLSNDKESLTAELKQLTETLAKTRTQIKDQDTNIKKQWFFNGAMVLGVGLLLGLILPRFFARRRESMKSWS